MPNHHFASAAAVDVNRLVKVNGSGQVLHAGATDENYIGASLSAVGSAQPVHTAGPIVCLKSTDALLKVEVAAANTLDEGDIAYQAADGKCASSGTVRVGVVMTGAAAAGIAMILPD